MTEETKTPTKTAKHNRFAKRSGCYVCLDCGKKTRDTGNGEAECEMCLKCYNAALEENALSDGE